MPAFRPPPLVSRSPAAIGMSNINRHCSIQKGATKMATPIDWDHDPEIDNHNHGYSFVELVEADEETRFDYITLEEPIDKRSLVVLGITA